jgi:hypothetical protein
MSIHSNGELIFICLTIHCHCLRIETFQFKSFTKTTFNDRRKRINISIESIEIVLSFIIVENLRIKSKSNNILKNR